MNISLTTDASLNPYASTLMCALSKSGFDVVSILSAEKSSIEKLKRELRRGGVGSAIRKVVPNQGTFAAGEFDNYGPLREFATENSLNRWSAPLTSLANEFGIDYTRVPSINSKLAIRSINDHSVDIIVNAGGGIFRKSIVNAPKIGILNAHMGYLPTFRGMNVLEWSLLHHHKLGITLHFIDTGIDTGDILLFKELPICELDTILSLRAKALPLSVEAVVEGVKGLADGSLRRIGQRAEDGKQFFVMHERLKRIAERNIGTLTASGALLP
jgi:methionyl-tRNA formyltransferase